MVWLFAGFGRLTRLICDYYFDIVSDFDISA
jgi:hypothetical protein